jgi:hypothetical protein
MSKEYFSHDYGTRNKKRMAALLEEEKSRGYGLFWIIVEMLHEDSTKWMELEDLTYIAIKKESGEDLVYIRGFIEKCISLYKVFIKQENRFTTERVLRNIDKREEIKEKRSRAGKISAEKRVSHSINYEQIPTHVEHVLNGVEHNSTKERKEKEIKGKENINRANALVGAVAPTSVQQHEIKKKYNSLTESLNDKPRAECWNSIKEFIQEVKPEFCEPYVDAWNLFADTYKLQKVDLITEKRKKKFLLRIREPAFDFINIMGKVRTSSFLKGDNQSQWKVDFNFIINSEDNYIKILEGKYD